MLIADEREESLETDSVLECLRVGVSMLPFTVCVVEER
jgi:hypothetical protein